MAPRLEPHAWSHRLRAGPETSREARWFLWQALKDDEPPADMDTAVLLTSELASNAARHGEEPIELSITVEEEGLRVSVYDQGPGFDPGEELGRSAGWGLGLIDQLSSDWGIERGDQGTEVWFRL